MQRVIIALALVGVLVATHFSGARAQALEPQGLVLTASEVPANLRVARSETVSRGGGPGYQVFFEVADPFRVGDDSIVQVVNVVALPSDPAGGLREFIGNTQGVFGGLTEQGPVPVGDESRAYTSSVSVGPFTGSRAVVLFRRGPAVVGVTVSSTSATAPLGEAVRMAQIVDARLLALSSGAAE
ncbi:MAG TPA: hypothetical protein VKZ60_01230 [Chloroflexota bacterium]|jgi:hypothetical protein|nr:hypothetical protein [Chloroflexota bacterium]